MLSWDESIERFSCEHGTIINIGPVDTGKTSWVAEVLRRRGGEPIGLISGDLGQVTFGAPGLLSAALVNPDVESLSEVQPDRVFFVGKNQPGGRFLQTTQGLTRLTTWLRFRSDIIYVDTDGFVTGPAAREYKRILLSQLQPCTAVFFGNSPDLSPLLTWCQSQKDIITAKVTVPSGVRTKTARQRQRYRLSRLQSWFQNASTVGLPFRENRIMSDTTTVGRPVSHAEYRKIHEIIKTPPLHAEKSSSWLNILSHEFIAGECLQTLRREYPDHRVHIQQVSEWKNKLIGDFREDEYSSGMGYVTGWRENPPTLVIKVRTLRAPGNIWMIGQTSFREIVP